MTFEQLHLHHWSQLQLLKVLCLSFSSNSNLVESHREAYILSRSVRISLWIKPISLNLTYLFWQMGHVRFAMLNHPIIFMFEFQSLAQPQKEKSVLLMSIKHGMLGFRMHCDFEIQGKKAYEKKIPNCIRMLHYLDWALIHQTSFWLVRVWLLGCTAMSGFYMLLFSRIRHSLFHLCSVLIWPP